MSEMQFGSTDQGTEFRAVSGDAGEVLVGVVRHHPHGLMLGHDHLLTLQQTIQLRDFLNRHIDTLALASIGAETVRSSDDPAQLPAEHVLQGTPRSGMSEAYFSLKRQALELAKYLPTKDRAALLDDLQRLDQKR